MVVATFGYPLTGWTTACGSSSPLPWRDYVAEVHNRAHTFSHVSPRFPICPRRKGTFLFVRPLSRRALTISNAMLAERNEIPPLQVNQAALKFGPHLRVDLKAPVFRDTGRDSSRISLGNTSGLKGHLASNDVLRSFYDFPFSS